MGLNRAQSHAVNCDDKHILCLAGAGTGKTFSMISRINRLVKSGVDPTAILALTFTNAAAFEMKERYEKQNGGRCPEFRTFHSFCYSLVSSDINIRKHLGYSQIPEIVDEEEKKQIEYTASIQMGIKLSNKLIEHPEKMSSLDKRNYEFIQKSTARLMCQKNIITFDRLCKSICDLFINDDPLIHIYKNKYKHVFVDEFQDTDQLQWLFIQSFETSNIFAVGDAQQAIYAFRGADSSIIKAVAADPSWTVIKLKENYRSTRQICEFSNVFVTSYADSSYRVCIESRIEGANVKELIDSHSKHLYKANVSESTLDEVVLDIAKHKELNSVAILCRTNTEVASVCDYLKNNDLSYITSKNDDIPKRLLKCLVDEEFALTWLSSLLDAKWYTEYIRCKYCYQKSGDEYTLDKFKDDFGKLPAVSTYVRIIDEAKNMLLEHTEDDNRELHIAVILTTLGYSYTVASALAAKMCESDSEEVDILEYCENFLENEKPDDNYIYVGTIHSVKGLEYDSVYVMNVDSNTFKLNCEENNNLFYVAVTRAKKLLTVYYSE